MFYRRLKQLANYISKGVKIKDLSAEVIGSRAFLTGREPYRSYVLIGLHGTGGANVLSCKEIWACFPVQAMLAAGLGRALMSVGFRWCFLIGIDRSGPRL